MMNLKIRLEYKGSVFEYEHQPMKEGRFRALCGLAWGVIGGAVLLVAVRMVGFSAIAAAVVAVLVGLGRLAGDLTK